MERKYPWLKWSQYKISVNLTDILVQFAPLFCVHNIFFDKCYRNVRWICRLRNFFKNVYSTSISAIFIEKSVMITKKRRVVLKLEVCKKIRFDFRSDIGLRRMSNIRHSISRPSNVEYSTIRSRDGFLTFDRRSS